MNLNSIGIKDGRIVKTNSSDLISHKMKGNIINIPTL